MQDSPSTEATKKGKRRETPAFLRALGPTDLPDRLTIAGEPFVRGKTLKHDFFAATGLYHAEADANRKMIYKVGRRYSLFGFPMAWLGRKLTRREARLYSAFADLDGVPNFAGLIDDSSFAHVYVEGRPLRKGDVVNDEFFPRLEAIMQQVHERRAAYVDFEKRENIIVGDDGWPYLIDFQISFQQPNAWWGKLPTTKWLLHILQTGDRYHLMKHWRRIRPDQLDEATIAKSRQLPWYIVAFRVAINPFQLFRRRTLAAIDPARANYKRA